MAHWGLTGHCRGAHDDRMTNTQTDRLSENLRDSFERALIDLAILAGDFPHPDGVTWQDVAGTAACNLRVLASYIEDARKGPRPTFPSTV